MLKQVMLTPPPPPTKKSPKLNNSLKLAEHEEQDEELGRGCQGRERMSGEVTTK